MVSRTSKRGARRAKPQHAARGRQRPNPPTHRHPTLKLLGFRVKPLAASWWEPCAPIVVGTLRINRGGNRKPESHAKFQNQRASRACQSRDRLRLATNAYKGTQLLEAQSYHFFERPDKVDATAPSSQGCPEEEPGRPGPGPVAVAARLRPLSFEAPLKGRPLDFQAPPKASPPWHRRSFEGKTPLASERAKYVCSTGDNSPFWNFVLGRKCVCATGGIIVFIRVFHNGNYGLF